MSDPPRGPRFFPHVNDPPAAGLADLDEARALHAELDPALFDEANDPKAWLFEPAVQALIAEVVEEAAAPWAAALPPEGLAALREEIEMACHTDATMIEYLDRLRPRADNQRSGKTPKGVFTRSRGAASSESSRAKKAGGERS